MEDICTVIGIREYSFKDGRKTIEGVSIWYTMKDDGWDGEVAAKVSLSYDLLEEINWQPEVGQQFIPIYRRGSDKFKSVKMIGE